MSKIINKCFKTVKPNKRNSDCTQQRSMTPFREQGNSILFHCSYRAKTISCIIECVISILFSFLFFFFFFFFFFLFNRKIFLPRYTPYRVSISQISREYRIHHQSVFTKGEKSWNRRSVQARI